MPRSLPTTQISLRQQGLKKHGFYPQSHPNFLNIIYHHNLNHFLDKTSIENTDTPQQNKENEDRTFRRTPRVVIGQGRFSEARAYFSFFFQIVTN